MNTINDITIGSTLFIKVAFDNISGVKLDEGNYDVVSKPIIFSKFGFDYFSINVTKESCSDLSSKMSISVHKEEFTIVNNKNNQTNSSSSSSSSTLSNLQTAINMLLETKEAQPQEHGQVLSFSSPHHQLKSSEVLTACSFIPKKNENYVKYGLYSDIKKIIKSKIFYPCYITGQSGNGKSEMVMQCCNDLKQECIRVNITSNTNEDDLIGMYTLQNGNYHWMDGPVLIAMKRGAILLLDEIDSGRPDKLFCLQTVLEGTSIFVKKQNIIVSSVDGFNIIATANTKGHGNDGRYIGAQLQNAAFLDRFSICFEQDFPNAVLEKKILLNYYNSFISSSRETNHLIDVNFVINLVQWAQLIREAFKHGACEELISTRRLINIIKAYVIFGDKEKSISYCTNQFDQASKDAFKLFYSSVDEQFICDKNIDENQTEIIE